MRSSLFCDVRQGRRTFRGQLNGSIFKGYAVKHSAWTVWPFKMGQTGCPEMSVITNLRCVTSQKNENLREYILLPCYPQAVWIMLYNFRNWIYIYTIIKMYCATNRKVAGSIADGVIGIFHWHNPSDRTVAMGSTQPLTEMSTRSISWG
jgi:hypothetical protein